MPEIVIVAAKRTAIGNFMGGFAKTPATQLGASLAKAIISEINIKPNEVSEVILGQVLTAAQGQNPARQTTILAGLENETPALTINQVCGSGLRAVALGAQAIVAGDSKIIIAGGQENMSLAKHAAYLRSGVKMGEAKFEDTMIIDGLWDAFNNYHMGITAENVAKKFKITRQMQDEFALNSQQKASAAIAAGKFDNEILAIETKNGIIDKDEYPRETSLEKLTSLTPVFDENGSVTAGNASGLNDGAAMVVLMSADEAARRGLKPLAKIKAWAQAGIDPKIMGTGPIKASQKALEKSGWSVADLDLIEANEAFAAQAIAVNNELGWDLDKVNVNGGAIALGHPIGASGCRILVSLIHEMQKRDAKKALATLCIGGGMGIALTLER